MCTPYVTCETFLRLGSEAPRKLPSETKLPWGCVPFILPAAPFFVRIPFPYYIKSRQLRIRGGSDTTEMKAERAEIKTRQYIVTVSMHPYPHKLYITLPLSLPFPRLKPYHSH